MPLYYADQADIPIPKISHKLDNIGPKEPATSDLPIPLHADPHDTLH